LSAMYNSEIRDI